MRFSRNIVDILILAAILSAFVGVILLVYEKSVDSDLALRASVAEVESAAAQAGLPFRLDWRKSGFGFLGRTFTDVSIRPGDIFIKSAHVKKYKVIDGYLLPVVLDLALEDLQVKLPKGQLASLVGVEKLPRFISESPSGVIHGNLSLYYRYVPNTRTLIVKELSLQMPNIGRLVLSSNMVLPTAEEFGRMVLASRASLPTLIRSDDPQAIIALLSEFKASSLKIKFSDSGFKGVRSFLLSSLSGKGDNAAAALSEQARRADLAQTSGTPFEKQFFPALYSFLSGNGRFTLSISTDGRPLPIREIFALAFKGSKKVSLDMSAD